LSFFDDDEPPATATHQTRPPRPRRPDAPGARAADQQTIMVRRGVAFGIGLILLFLVVLFISSCESSARTDAVRNYNNDVVRIGHESELVGNDYFAALGSAQGKSAAQVGPELDAIRSRAQQSVNDAKGLSVPGDLDGAQSNLLLSLDLREEAVADVANQIPVALGGLSDAGPAIKRIAGDNEQILASDVIFQVRVSPLIAQQVASHGIQAAALPSSVWVKNLSWLQEGYVAGQLTGATGTGTNGTALAPGTHGHSLTSVSVGGNTLAPAPQVNNISGGANPTFSVTLQNTGSNPETAVGVQVSVTAEGQKRTTTKTIPLTKPGSSYTIPVQVQGVPLQVPARVIVTVLPVPGEKNVANNTGTFTSVFGP
jgi:hypothetical protein